MVGNKAYGHSRSNSIKDTKHIPKNNENGLNLQKKGEYISKLY